MYTEYFISETNTLLNNINNININSLYKIKKYIHQDFINMLTNIDIDHKVSYKPLLNDNSCIPLLINHFKINDINLLENKISSIQKSIDNIINCSELYSIDDKNMVKILKVIYENSFMPLQIIQWIEKCSYYYLLTWNNIKVHIINNEIINSDYINHIILIIKWLITIANKININMDIYLFLSDIKKILPSICTKIYDYCPLNSINVNSGVSWAHNWIQIFRKEELFKVLIHELIHYLKLDVNKYSHILDSKCAHIKMDNKSNSILVNEAYTEILAIYLHTIYISKYIVDKENLNFDDIFWDLYMNEERFTLYQINKIFQYYNISDISYFKNNNNFIQYTNVISYYIIKYLFFINTIYFIKNYNNYKIIVNLILYLLKNFFNLKIPKYDQINDNSLRMSIYQLN